MFCKKSLPFVFLFTVFASTWANSSFIPYVSLRGGISSQSIYGVTFENPRAPQLMHINNNSAPPLFALAIGTRLAPTPIRGELQGTYVTQGSFSRDYYFPAYFNVIGIQKIRVQSSHLLIKGYYDFPFSIVTPYISAGIGVAWNRTTATQLAPQLLGWLYDFVGTTQSNFAWSAGIGVNKNLCERVDLEIGLNYVAAGRFDTGVLPHTGDEHIFGKLRSIDLLVGLTYKFVTLLN